jgi:hypothetical protein
MLTGMIAVMLGFIAICLLFMGWLAFKSLTQTVRLRRRGHRVKGKVVKIELEDAGESPIRWVTVAYSAAGEEYRYRYWTGQFVMDQEVTLLHSPDNPREVQVLDWTTQWLVPLLLLLPIVVVLGVGILLLALRE